MNETDPKTGITVSKFVCIFPNCPPGTNDGTIIIEAYTNKKQKLEFSIDGGQTWQTGGTFNNLSPGVYDIQIRIIGNKTIFEYRIVEFPAPLCNEDCTPPRNACGTMLYPGELMFCGFDNNYYYGDDRVIISTLIAIKPYTNFIITNAVYEAGAEANERTDKWYGPNGRFDAEIASQRITYTGSRQLAAGTIICFDLPSRGTQVLARNFKINGKFSSDFCVEDVGNAPLPRVNISTSKPDALFLMQGDWTYTKEHGEFCGTVLSGIQNGGKWHEFSEDVPEYTRRSRRPSAIDCLAIQGLTSPKSIMTFFQPTKGTYTPFDLLSEIIVYKNWMVENGTGKNDLPRTACEKQVRVVSK